MKGYSYTGDTRTAVARARGVELPISPKKTYEVLNAIRGKDLEDARKYLEEVERMERAVPFRRFNQETAHKKGIGPGRYPIKVARSLLQVLQNAESNAEYEGLDTDQLFVYVAAASRGKIQKANMPRAHGRATPWNEQTTHIEIVLRERGEA
jgi:large subunit ribosomal protein L22